jgi:lysophospholipase L1-like esterase
MKAVIDLNAPLSGANFTVDGVHLNSAGYELWRSKIFNGIEAALDCV